jgi:carbon storage regulator
MLVLARKLGETIEIEGGITLMVVAIHGNSVRVGVEAPRHLAVHRGEVQRTINAEGRLTPSACGEEFLDY